MTPDRKKPGVAFWATVVVVVGLVGYPLAIGPCLYAAQRWGRQSIFEYPFFKPAFIVYERLPRPMKKPVRDYFRFWISLGLEHGGVRQA